MDVFAKYYTPTVMVMALLIFLIPPLLMGGAWGVWAYRALVLLGTFASLRWAELAALRPSDIDLDLCTIRVDRQLIEQLAAGRPSVRPSLGQAGAPCRSPT